MVCYKVTDRMKINFQALYDNVGYQDEVIHIMKQRGDITDTELETLQKALYTLYHFNKQCVKKFGNGYVEFNYYIKD